MCKTKQRRKSKAHWSQTNIDPTNLPYFHHPLPGFLLECAMHNMLLMSFLPSSCEYRFFLRHPWCHCRSCRGCKLQLAGGFTPRSLRPAGLLLQLFSSLCLHDTIFGLPSHSPLSSNVSSCGDWRAKFIKMEFGGLLHKITSIYICCLSLSMLYVFYHLILPLPVHANFQWAAVVNSG